MGTLTLAADSVADESSASDVGFRVGYHFGFGTLFQIQTICNHEIATNEHLEWGLIVLRVRRVGL